MFKRFSTNYIISLFLLDIIAIQLALWLAFRLRFVIPLGQTVRIEWVSGSSWAAMVHLFYPLCLLYTSADHFVGR